MGQRIVIAYKEVAGIPGLMHKYFLLEDTVSGTRLEYGRAGPSNDTSGLPGTTLFGNLIVQSGVYDDESPDWIAPEEDDRYREQVMLNGVPLVGEDLTDEWEALIAALNDLHLEMTYGGFQFNSNTAVDLALWHEGYDMPQGDDLGEEWSPGSLQDSGPGQMLFPPAGSLQLPFGNMAPGLRSPGSLFGNAPRFGSPLILDLDGDGIETTKLGFHTTTSQVYFDANADGFAERTGWVTGGDGLLVWDRDSNGTIDDGSEWFGNTAMYADGFLNLATVDSNNDDIVNSSDTDWASLRIWVDADCDGATDGGELHTLSSLSITAISLNATPLSNSYNNENLVTATSTFTIGGNSRTIADVWFRFDSADTYSLAGVEFNEAVCYLPTLVGSGRLENLSAAMSIDSALLGLVAEFASEWTTERFGDAAALDSDVRDILFKWAGVDGVGPTSRGAYCDGQELAFLERFYGSTYLEISGSVSNPSTSGQGAGVTAAFNALFEELKASLVVQVASTQLFDGAAYYDTRNGAVIAEALSLTAIADIGLEADSATDAEEYWVAFATTILRIRGAEALTAGEISALDSAVQVSLPLLAWDDIAIQVDVNVTSTTLTWTDFADLIAADAGNDILSGGAGDDLYVFERGFGQDTITDSSGADAILFSDATTLSDLRFWRTSSTNGALQIFVGSDRIDITAQLSDRHAGANTYDEVETIIFADSSTFNLMGDLTFTGTSSNETVYGVNNSNDTLIGLAGNDNLNGYSGNDTYFFASGFGLDEVTDSAGSDRISFGAGIALTDLRFWRTSATNNALEIHIGSNKITINSLLYDRHNGVSSTDEVETLLFSDTSTFNLLGALTFTGTSSNETVYGVNNSDDTLKGLGGNDTLNGYSGNDTYFFSTGFGTDTVNETSGTDKLSFGTGIALTDIRFWRTSSTSVNLDVIIGSDKVTINDMLYDRHNGTSTKDEVESILFNDTSTFNLLGNLTFTGTSSGETVHGVNNANDTLYGLGGADTLYGYSGDDTLFGGAAADTLNGGTGADTFAFDDDGLGTSDTIADFSLANGDKLDLSRLLEEYDPLTELITDFVQITTSGSNSIVKVDIDGGANGFVQIASITGVTGLTDEAALETSGSLIT